MRKTILAATAAAAMFTVPALAQSATTGTTTGTATGTTADGTTSPQQDDDDDMPWGLLGLIGLAGLLGRKRNNDPDLNRRTP